MLKNLSQRDAERILVCLNELQGKQIRLFHSAETSGNRRWLITSRWELRRTKRAIESVCPTKKRCVFCLEMKPFADFYLQRKYGKIYRQSGCIVCKRKLRMEERALRRKDRLNIKAEPEATGEC